MRYRVTFFAGFAVGFLVGARAGRERYEQIMKLSRQAAGHPAVRQATQTITVKTTEITKTAASQMPKLVETARNRAGDRLQGARSRIPGVKGRVPGPRDRSDSASVNGARP